MGCKAVAEPAARFLELKLAATAEPVKPSPTAVPMIEVRLQHGRSLMIAPDFDATHLQRLLAVLDPAIPVDKSSSAAWQPVSKTSSPLRSPTIESADGGVSPQVLPCRSAIGADLMAPALDSSLQRFQR